MNVNHSGENVAVFYFSGTGNTWWVSEELARCLVELGYTVHTYSIETLSEGEPAQIIDSADLVGFGYPIHGSDLPLPMKEFIAGLSPGPGKKALVFCTQWLWSGDGASVGGTMLHERGFDVRWGEHFLMPNNVTVSIVTLPYTNDHGRLAAVLARAKKKASVLAGNIGAGRVSLHGFNSLSFYLGCMQRIPFRKIYHRLQNDIGIDTENCIDCKECVRLCPVGNLYYEGDRIKTRGNCVLCLRCYNFCPVAAVTHMGRPHRHERGEPYRGPIKDFDPGVLITRKSML